MRSVKLNLTKEQSRHATSLVKKYIAQCYRTDPIDRPAATRAMQQLYTIAGFAEPEVKVASGPREYGYHPFSGKLFDKFKIERGHLTAAWNRVANIRTQELRPVLGFGHEWMIPFERTYIARYELARDLKLIQPQPFWEKLVEVSTLIGPSYHLTEEIVYLTERPEIFLRGNHSETGPVIRYRDGSALYMIRGVRVPAVLVEDPDSITIDMILKERNTEVRRLMRERYGEPRFLQDIGAKVIDTDVISTHARRTRAQTIMRALLEDLEGRRFLVGTDGSTGRTYYMEVPAMIRNPRWGAGGEPFRIEINTCRAAHEFLGGIDESKLIAQT